MATAHSLKEVFALLDRGIEEKVVDGYAVVGAMAVPPRRQEQLPPECASI